MITVVEFRAKQVADTNYVFIGIDLDWLEHPKVGKILVIKSHISIPNIPTESNFLKSN